MWQLPLLSLWSLSCQLSTFVFKWQNCNFHSTIEKQAGVQEDGDFICTSSAMRAFASITRAGGSWSPVLIVSWAQAIAYKAAVWIVPILPSLYSCIACLELSKRIQRLALSLQMGRLRLREAFWTAQHREAEGGLGIEPSLPWSGANAAGTRPNRSPEGGWGTEGESGQTWHCWWKQTPRARGHLFQYSDPCRLGRFRTTDLLVTFLFFLVQLRCLKQWKNCSFIWHH